MKKIAIFASGSGTNAEAITRYFNKNQTAKVALILTNNRKAYVLERAKRLNVPAMVFGRTELYDTRVVLSELKSFQIDIIVLAGFLWFVPEELIRSYPGRIINIHPALLPKYGGKGMYGERVHKAVIEAGEKESGISIHYVNEKYDEGGIIKQAKVSIDKEDTPDSLAAKIHELEYKHYPEVIESVILNI